MKNVQRTMSLVLYFAPDPQLFLIVYLQHVFYDNQVLTRCVGFLFKWYKMQTVLQQRGMRKIRCVSAKLNQWYFFRNASPSPPPPPPKCNCGP